MKELVCMQLHLTAADSQKNIAVPFFMPRDAEKMVISLHYSPKTPEDRETQLELARENIRRDAPGEWGREYHPESFLPLKNLITLSLDDPVRYRGCAHRQNPEQEHTLSVKTASPGFLPGELPGGSWRLMLNVHALVTPACDCQIRVSVQTKEAEE